MAVRLLFSLMLALALAGCSSRSTDGVTTGAAKSEARPEGAGMLAPVSAQSAEPTPVEDGRRIFIENCARCHGPNADGNTTVGRAWKVPVLGSQQVQSLSDAQLQTIIRQGKGKMPPWEALLSNTDIDHVLAYVRSLKKN